ncbi:MAG TPA: Ig-like domain-containing protein, partial [Herpetosiphonaceae bacterium]|nr:Ig-like domain-containing protein [Herpetosiphonaceae bacterium]
MKRRYVGLAAIIGIIGVVAGVLLFRRAGPPIIGQATPVPTRPRPDYTPQPADAVAPIVVERMPERGEELAADGVVQLVFDRAMDRESVAAALSVSPPVDGTIEWANDRTLRFTPRQPLTRAALYDVVLSQAAKASDGAALNSAYQFRFTTAGFLEVAQALPADGSNEVEAEAVVTAVFNRPVVALKVAEDQDTQPQPLSFDPPLEGAGEWLSTSVYVFRPARPLAGGTTYTVSINDLKDVEGNPLEQPYSWSWTTVRPKLVFSYPAADDTRPVSVEPEVSLQFNQPIDQASAESSIQLRSEDGAAVPISVEVYSETVYLSPTERLEFDARYEV